MIIENQALSLFEFVVKQKTLFEFFFLIFFIKSIMDLFDQLVLVMCNPLLAG